MELLQDGKKFMYNGDKYTLRMLSSVCKPFTDLLVAVKTTKDFTKGFVYKTDEVLIKCFLGYKDFSETFLGLEKIEEESNNTVKLLEDGIKLKYDSDINISEEPNNTEEINPKTLVGSKKVSPALVPACAVLETAMALELGRLKYGRMNWRDKKIPMMTYLNASLRHIYQLLDNDDIDEETGRTHFASISANMAILIDAMYQGTLIDDRNKKTNGSTVKLLKELNNFEIPFVKNNPDYNFKETV